MPLFGNFDWSGLVQLFFLLSDGFIISVKVFVLTILFSLPLGLITALGRMSKSKLINGPVKLFILIMRGTPLILQIAFVYFAPFYIFPEGLKINLDRLVAAILACTLNYAAYFAEIYRGGIESIPKGQYEAAAVLGFSRPQTFVRIILPQVIKRILPPVSNEIITLVKDTALVSTIGIVELYRIATGEASRVFSSVPLLFAALFYLFMNWVVTEVLQKAEKKLSYYR